MPKFNWEGKTGITEAQWAQVVQAILWLGCYKLGYQEVAMHGAAASTIIIGGVGKFLRSQQKIKFREIKKGLDGADVLVKSGVTEREILNMVKQRSSSRVAADRLKEDKNDTDK